MTVKALRGPILEHMGGITPAKSVRAQKGFDSARAMAQELIETVKELPLATKILHGVRLNTIA